MDSKIQFSWILPPGGLGNLRIVPSVSLHAVKGSEWIVRMVLGSRSLRLFPRERVGLLIEGTACSIIDYIMQTLVVSGRASDLLLQCHNTFYQFRQIYVYVNLCLC